MKIIYYSLLLLLMCPGILDARKQKGLVLCTWNIGHFSNGNKHYSLIRADDYKEQLKLYRTFIYKDLCPDIIAVNEYNYLFCEKDDGGEQYKTSSLLFDIFKKSIIGSQYNGICNAVFSNVKIKRSRFFYFESHKNTDGDVFTKSRENYFIESDIVVNGKKVKMVCFHLLFSQEVGNIYQQNQIAELINNYKDIKRVIMCGDWNTETYSSIKNAGYALANDGSLKTFPSKGYALDNIAVKGLDISDVRMVKTDLSDHYPLVCRVSLK